MFRNHIYFLLLFDVSHPSLPILNTTTINIHFWFVPHFLFPFLQYQKHTIPSLSLCVYIPIANEMQISSLLGRNLPQKCPHPLQILLLTTTKSSTNTLIILLGRVLHFRNIDILPHFPHTFGNGIFGRKRHHNAINKSNHGNTSSW